jgi:hypothetical protein
VAGVLGWALEPVEADTPGAGIGDGEITGSGGRGLSVTDAVGSVQALRTTATAMPPARLRRLGMSSLDHMQHAPP